MQQTAIRPWGIYSIWHRHARVHQNTWLWDCVSPASEPILYLLAFGYGLTPIVHELNYQEHLVSYRAFIAPGMIALGVVFHSFIEGSYSSFTRLQQKTWDALLTAPVSFAEIFIAEWLWAATMGLIAALLIGTVTVLLGLYPLSYLALSLPLVLLGSLTFGAIGLITAGWIRRVDQVNLAMYFLIIPMYVLCGIYFPRYTLPTLLHWISNVLPLSILVDLLRWPLGISAYWWVEVLGLITFTIVLARFAAHKIYTKVVR